MTARGALNAMLASKEMVLVVGSGGVGKTTTSAALGVHATTEIGGRVLVVTVDPARRLADAFAVNSPSAATKERGEIQQVPDEAFRTAGLRPRGELYLTMLDTKAGWDDLIDRTAPTREIRDAVLANPLYDNITSRFVNSHDYLAIERLYELHASGEFDLIIVDTPPSRNALDVLDAPGRMKEFFGSRLLRWLTIPYRQRLFSVASRPFYQIADRVLGSNFLGDVAEFFLLFQTMEPSFVAHANEVETLLADPRSAFVVVTTLEAAPTFEAGYLIRELARRNLPLGAIIANRVLPSALTARTASASARKLANKRPRDDMLESAAAQLEADPAVVDAVVTEIGSRFPDIAVVATREAERRAELAALVPDAPVVDLVLRGHDISDLRDLAAMFSPPRGR